ncbi:MAG: hypothetical protein HYZ53_00920 [Planctomycetes bacterium]|nr:hypothetical protein [Planctomycetota bacterium]
MCLMVWVGSTEALSADDYLRDLPEAAYFRIEAIPTSAPVRAHFSSRHVTYVGSHQGCGCGFNSDEYTFRGFALVADVVSLLSAMSQKERGDFDSSQLSRRRIYDLVGQALRGGPVELFCCWAGEESEPAKREVDVHSCWIIEYLSPLEEGSKYLLRT